MSGILCWVRFLQREKLNKIMEDAQSIIEADGFECIEAEWNQHDQVLRLYVDREGGVDMDACARVTSLLKDISVIDGIEPGQYNLEVSSPGVERPLRKKEHFQKAIGKEIAVHLMASSGKKHYQGVLVSVDNETLVMRCDNEDKSVPFESVRKANIVFNWGS